MKSNSVILIDIDDVVSIGDAIKQIEKYQKWVEQKSKRLCEELAKIGAQTASVRFSSAMYDGTNDVYVTVTETDKGFKIDADGQAVCFIEFGAGVWHNGWEPYPNQRPPGVVGIGEYGKGMGKRNGWMYTDASGEKVFTRGNPAAMPMFYASEEIRQKVQQIAKEVFSNGD